MTTTDKVNVEAWKQARLGKIQDGVIIGKLIVSNKKGSYQLSKSKTAEDFIYKIAWERLLKKCNNIEGLDRLEISSKAIEHGNLYEQNALDRYELETFSKVADERFIELNEYVGGTPDGFIGADGLIEIKCPYNGANHLKTLTTKEVYNKEHLAQMQFYLYIADRQWCDYVTYDPHLRKGLDLSITRIERDEEMINTMKEIINQVNEQINEINNKKN